MLANDRLTFVAENVEQSSPHPGFTKIFRELCVERLAEYFVLNEVVSKVVDWNRVKEVFPSNVLDVVDAGGANVRLDSGEAQDEVLDIHVVVNELFQFIVFDLATAIFINILEHITDVLSYADFIWRW